MSEYFGIVCKIEKLEKHPNADKLQILKLFGTQTIVGLDAKIDDLGVYFREGLQLSEEFCDYNHLCRTLPNGDKDTGYMERNKRNVKTVKLRGEYSDGIFCPLNCLEYTGVDLSSFVVGDHIEVINGKEIVRKYVPFHRPSAPQGKQNGTAKKKKIALAPDFAEHVDTQQLAYNLGAFQPGDTIEISLKMHGTSARTAHTKVLKGYKRSLLDRILRREGKPIYELGYATGTRRTIIDDFNNDSGFYGDNKFREPAARFFEGKLRPNEACYYELVGYTTSGSPIMASAKNTDPDIMKQYGDVIEFSYGCSPNGKKTMYGRDVEDEIFAIEQEVPQCDFYVYRITQTLDDGTVIEYTGDQMRRRCAEWGCKCVPLLWRGIIPEDVDAGEFVINKAREYYDGPDPIGKSHIREGVVVRVENREGYICFKYKNDIFKLCAGIALDTADMAKMSEDQIAEL